MGLEWKRKGSPVAFQLFLFTLLLSLLINPVAAGSKQEKRKNAQLKQTIPSVSPSSSSKGSSLNSTRNTRQTPEIPALYSAPKIPTPDIPALYSAPKVQPDIPALYSAPKGGQDSQNEVDYEMKMTTEVSISDEDSSEDEGSSESIQYGVPTEKYGAPLGDPIQDDAYPTDSPATQRTKDQSSEEEPDSYNTGYNNHANEPIPQYGPPQPPSTEQKPPPPPSRGFQPSPQGNSQRKQMNGNRRPSDQQQIENSQQPMSQIRPNGENNGPGGFYLPPPSQELERPAEHREEAGASSYGQNPAHFPQPNTNFEAPPQQPQNNGHGAAQPTQFQHSSSAGYTSPNGGGSHPQDPSQQRSGNFPQQGNQGSPHESQQQGQHFGRDSNNPSSFYGLPSVNHFDSNNQDEMEGLNEKIVDAELLQRVQQIIEDHERQQKVILDNLQKDSEKAFSRIQNPSGASSPFTGNELSGPSAEYGTPGIAHSPDYNLPNYNFKPNGFGNNGPGAPSSYPFPNSNSINNSPPSTGSGYPDSNSYDANRNAYNAPRESNPGQDYGQNRNNGGNKPSSFPGGFNNGFQQGQGNEPKKLSSDVEYQKAVLSTHFTETQPDPQFAKAAPPSRPAFVSQGQPTPQLNNVAGPGEEYLPPADNRQQEQQRPAYDAQPNGPNGGYSNSFGSAEHQNQGGRPNGEGDNYSVKVGTGILVSGDNGANSKPSPPSFNYGPPGILPGSPQNEEFHPRQEPGAFPSPQNSYESPVNAPPPNPPFWARSPGPQPVYGPPPTPGNNFFPNDGSQSGNQNQIQYQNPTGNSVVGNNPGDQRPFVQPQYLPPTPPAGSGPFSGNPNEQQPQAGHQPFPGAPTNLDPNGNTEPRPIYGIPLAPVISLDSDNKLQSFNDGGVGGQGRSVPGSYSPDAIKTFQPGSLNPSLQGHFNQASPNGNYLPPSHFNPSVAGGGGGNIGDLSNSPHFQSSPNSAIYGIPDNNPSSSSSTYLNIQGHNGNSNNHIYSINHNGYDTSVAPANGHDGSSLIIPGISNTFALPIYDYSSSNEQSGASTSTSPVVVPLEHLLQQLPHLQAAVSDNDNSPTIFYGPSPQDNFRVSRRALSKKASISPASNPNNKKHLSTSSNSTTPTRTNSRRSSSPPK